MPHHDTEIQHAELVAVMLRAPASIFTAALPNLGMRDQGSPALAAHATIDRAGLAGDEGPRSWAAWGVGGARRNRVDVWPYLTDVLRRIAAIAPGDTTALEALL